ncbi:hypothetical protein VNO77_42809 [Canavalia gladiata]|uniref:Uncharacterized protein n=1 Tax=Canavalia gladiata TaxID=3824 RepID=A0AAN9JT27_CANGL
MAVEAVADQSAKAPESEGNLLVVATTEAFLSSERKKKREKEREREREGGKIEVLNGPELSRERGAVSSE